jgi:MEKHLA domain
MIPAAPPTDLSVDPKFFDLLTRSYRELLRVPLVEHGQGPRWLYSEAPFAVLAHNTEPDPKFIYANKTAQRCFEYSWDEFVQTRSRFSAEALERPERDRLLARVAQYGFVTDYKGVRISKTGRQFWIEEGTLWQLVDAQGALRGQAAVFRSWRDV